MSALVLFLPLSKLLPLLIHLITPIPLSIEDFERVAMGALVLPQRLVLFVRRKQLKTSIQHVATTTSYNLQLIPWLCVLDKLAVVVGELSVSLVHWRVKSTKWILSSNPISIFVQKQFYVTIDPIGWDSDGLLMLFHLQEWGVFVFELEGDGFVSDFLEWLDCWIFLFVLEERFS